MKFTVKNDDFNDFAKCLYLVTQKIGYISLDNEDICKTFSDFDEIEFYTASADDPQHTYEALLKKIPSDRYDSGFAVFSISKALFDKFAPEFESLHGQLVLDCLHNDSNVLWGLYESDFDDICTLYFLCAKHNDTACE